MKKGFNYFLYIFSFILVFGVFYAIHTSKSTSSLPEDQEIHHMVSRLNEDLPRAIGTIGYLDSITYSNHTISYMISVNGDNGIKQIYTENYDDFEDMLKYSLLIMNGQRSMGMNLASFLERKELNIGVRIYTPDRTFTSWNFTGKELKEFATSCKLNPTEALHKVIEMQIKIANLDLPMKHSGKRNIETVALNSIMADEDESILLHSISYKDSQLILECIVDEKEFDLNAIQENRTNREYIETIASIASEDTDVREFFGMIVISHSDFVIRYVGQKSGKIAEVTIPYDIIKKYCVVPSFLLS